MSKYEEYLAIAEKMETAFEEKINDGEKVQIWFNPISDNLQIEMADVYGNHKLKIEGRTGEALFKALKQIYE
jgi:hypothetical protein